MHPLVVLIVFIAVGALIGLGIGGNVGALIGAGCGLVAFFSFALLLEGIDCFMV